MPERAPVSAAWAQLRSYQNADGSFSHITNPQSKNQSEEVIEVASPFLTAFIVSLIQTTSYSGHALASQICQDAVRWLQQQRNIHGRWNYWPTGSHPAQARPYPDDLDTTSCVLSALYRHDASLISGEDLARLVQLFSLQETSEGGPYRTWCVPKTAPDFYQDVDVAVNANIAFLWQQYEVELPALKAYLNQALSKSKLFDSPYYVGPYPILYFLSRVSSQLDSGLWQKVLTHHLEHRPPQNVEEQLLAALACQTTSLKVSTGLPLKALKYDATGWFPFITEPLLSKQAGYTGSPAVGLALWLAWTERQSAASEKSRNSNQKRSAAKKLGRMVEERVVGFVEALPEPLQGQGNQVIERLKHSGQLAKMSLFPSLLVPALTKKNWNSHHLALLGETTVYGWLAYTLYDDILDGDADLRQLGLANATLRQIAWCIQQLTSREPSLNQLFRQTLDRIDAANTWELQNTHFDPNAPASTILPQFGHNERLAEKSFGHALGPLWLFSRTGYSPKSLDFQNFWKFWQQYLIAKQLNDDAHDWQEDWQSGRHTPVTVLVWQNYLESGATWEEHPRDWHERKMNEWFLQRGLLKTCDEIENHLRQAQTAAQELSLVIAPQYAQALLQPLQQAVKVSRQQHSQAQDFVAAFEPSLSSNSGEV